MSQQTTIIKPPTFAQFIPFIIWLLIIFILLTLPQRDFDGVDMKIPFQDKLVHMGLFGGLVFFFGLAYRKIPFAFSKTKLVFMVLIATSYGIIMEFVQKYCTGHSRSFSYEDMVADGLGAVIGYFLVRYIITKNNTRLLK
ncbi:VanZ family protein [Arachidicoccus terrestris]|uniref:VanZ family protein n=1 Tax=Arachidicoccus terrestris TaxID=2875539 RepID=UPI001CC39566|nr:VanZ family protein [Arachidicoccus terrestris]UAY54381.1 VanZ family protein [Arachidicoccus terrestris]